MIEIKRGLYSGFGNTGVVFPPHPVLLMSENWGTNRSVEIQVPGFAAFMFSNEQDNRTIIRGLNVILTGARYMQTGFYLGQGNNSFTGAAPYFDGVRVQLGTNQWASGFYGFGSTPKTIRFNNCIVRGPNTGQLLSGVYLVNSPSVHLANCSFLNFNSSVGGSCGVLLGTVTDSYGGTARNARVENCFWDATFAASNNLAVAHTTGAAIRFDTEVAYGLLPNEPSLQGVDRNVSIIQTNGTALRDGLILSNSPCINAALQNPLSWYDFHGQIRGANPDIGADEYSAISTNDTDGDGLQDFAETFNYQTSIFNCDTDYDGVGDGDEIFCGTSPTNREHYCVTIAGRVDNRSGLSAPIRAAWSQGSSVWISSNMATVVNGQFGYAHKVFYSSQRIYVQVLVDLDGDSLPDSGEPLYTAPLSITNHTSGISFVLEDADGDKISDGTEISCGTDPNRKDHYCITLQGTVTNSAPATGPIYAAAVLVNQTLPPTPSSINTWGLEKAVLRQVAVTNGTFLLDHVVVDQRTVRKGWTLWLESYQDITTNAVFDHFEPSTRQRVSVTNHTMTYELELLDEFPDIDWDGIPDRWEYVNGLSFTNRVDSFADFDGDWIDNKWEYKLDLNPNVYNTNNYAFADAMRAVDSRIAGKNPTNSLHIFNEDCYTTTNFIRNTNCWAMDIDLTCISPWNSHERNCRAGTLISPRHILLAGHYMIPTNRVLRFVDKNNNVVDRTLVRSKRHPDYTDYSYPDLCVGILDSDVPTNTISFAKVLPDDFQNYIQDGRFLPSLRLDQEEKALIGDLYSITMAGLAGDKCTFFCTPVDPVRSSYYEPLVLGDSGNPAFLVMNNEAVLLTVWTGGGSGMGTSVTAFKNDINQMMSDLDFYCGVTSGYQLVEFDMSGFEPLGN